MQRTSTHAWYVDAAGPGPGAGARAAPAAARRRSQCTVTCTLAPNLQSSADSADTRQHSVRRPRGDTHTPRVRDDTVEGHRGKQRGYK